MHPLEEHGREIVVFITDSYFKEHLVAKILCTECILLNRFQNSNINYDSKIAVRVGLQSRKSSFKSLVAISDLLFWL